MTDVDCNSQISFYYNDQYQQYIITASDLTSKDYGKYNLDSIPYAYDSLLSDNRNTIGYGRLFRIGKDSLEQCEGNVYGFRCWIAPPMDCPLYVKMKILDFDYLDSAHSSSVRLIFLWVADICTGPNLITPAAVDTFLDLSTFDPEPTQIDDMLQRSAKNNSRELKTLNHQIVLGNKFTIPESWGNTNSVVGIYDLNGKLVGKVNCIGKRVIDLKKEFGVKTNGVWVVSSPLLK